MSDDFFRDPELTRIIQAILRRRGIRHEQDLEDATQDVRLALVVFSREKGLATAGEVAAAASSITGNIAARYWRQKHRDTKKLAEQVEDADAFAQEPPRAAVDPIDAKRTLALISDWATPRADTDKVVALLVALADGDSLAEHANETGQSPAAVRKAAERVDRRLEKHIAEAGKDDFGLARFHARAQKAVGAIIALAVLLLLGRSGHSPVPVPSAETAWAWIVRRLAPQPLPISPPRPDAPEDIPLPDDYRAEDLAEPEGLERYEMAEREVVRAEAAIARHEWRSCVEHLDTARSVDRTAFDYRDLRSSCALEADRQMDVKAPPRRR